MSAPDPLLARLRAADPATRLSGRDANHPRLAGMLRQRAARRRRRVAASGGLLALAATLALALAPSDRPDGSSLLVRAVQASELPRGSIVVIDNITTFDGRSERQTSWVLTAPNGRRLVQRTRQTAADPGGVPVGYEEVSTHLSHHPHLSVYNPLTGEVSVSKGVEVSPRSAFVFSAHKMLLNAQAQGARATRVRIVIAPGTAPRDVVQVSYVVYRTTRRTLTFDAKTFQPLLFRLGDPHRPPSRSDSIDRIVSERILPDTPHNRRFLRLRGPTR